MPANLFYGTGIPTCILIFKKNRKSDEVFFIDASGEDHFEKAKNQNVLREQDIERIVDTFEQQRVIDKYSYKATLKEIKENDYNLNIPRYVDTFIEEEPIDMQMVEKNIADIENELTEAQAKMSKYLKELGL